jgi:hypothetical protein
VFDHAKLILKYLQDHWQRNNYIFAIASRAWRLIYTYSHCNLCTVNADGLRVKQSRWISFEVCRQQSGKYWPSCYNIARHLLAQWHVAHNVQWQCHPRCHQTATRSVRIHPMTNINATLPSPSGISKWRFSGFHNQKSVCIPSLNTTSNRPDISSLVIIYTSCLHAPQKISDIRKTMSYNSQATGKDSVNRKIELS